MASPRPAAGSLACLTSIEAGELRASGSGQTVMNDSQKHPESRTGRARRHARRRLPDSPRDRLLRSSSAALSDAELLGLVLPGAGGARATELAASLLERSGGLAGLLHASEHQLRVPGVGRSGRAAVLAAIELSRRFAAARLPMRNLLERPDSVAAYLYLRHARRPQEIMGALYLDVRNRLIAEVDIFRGTLTRAAVEPRALLREAIAHNASGFILYHTHPSGDPSPSDEDLSFTRRMLESGELLGIKMLDHLILGSTGRWVSLQRLGVW